MAEGNARLAVLAAKVAIEENTLTAINDVSQLYTVFIGKYLQRRLQERRNVDNRWNTLSEDSFRLYKESLPLFCKKNGLTIDKYHEELHKTA